MATTPTPSTLTQSSHTLPGSTFRANKSFLVDTLGIPENWIDSYLTRPSVDIQVGDQTVTLRGNRIDLPTTGEVPVTPNGIAPSSHYNFDAARETYNIAQQEAISGIQKQYLANEPIMGADAARANAIRQLDGFVGGMQDGALDGRVALSVNDAKVQAGVQGMTADEAAYSYLQTNRAIAAESPNNAGFELNTVHLRSRPPRVSLRSNRATLTPLQSLAPWHRCHSAGRYSRSPAP